MDTTITFELPLGYEKDGKVHKSVTLRRMKGKDRRKIQGDARLKELAGRDINLLSPHPVKLFEATAAANLLYDLMLTQVVVNIGDITDISVDLLEDLYSEDHELLIRKHMEFNKVDLKEAAQGAPFPGGERS